MSFRIDAVETIFSVCVAASVAYFDKVNAGSAGFALGFALNYATVMVDTIPRYSGIELDMNPVEKVLEYSKIDIEAQDRIESPLSWLSEGRMIVSGRLAIHQSFLLSSKILASLPNPSNEAE